MKKLYFGRPVNSFCNFGVTDYKSKMENSLINQIGAIFSDHLVENPNHPRHEEGYQRYRDIEIDGKKRGMNYYFKEVLPEMDDGVFMSFPGGKFGLGVYGEAEFIKEKNNGEIYELGFDSEGFLFLDNMALDSSRCMSYEETIENIRGGKKDELPLALHDALLMDKIRILI